MNRNCNLSQGAAPAATVHSGTSLTSGKIARKSKNRTLVPHLSVSKGSEAAESIAMIFEISIPTSCCAQSFVIFYKENEILSRFSTHRFFKCFKNTQMAQSM